MASSVQRERLAVTTGMDVERRPRFAISNIDVRAHARDECDNHRVRRDYQRSLSTMRSMLRTLGSGTGN